MMALFVGFTMAVAWVLSQFIGGRNNNLLPFILAGSLIYVVISYYSGSKWALAVNGAAEIQKKDNPRLYRIVENLAITDGLESPRVFIIDDPAPNAFATGKDPKHSIVCVTSGLLDIMDDDELTGVLAHELGHVKNYDIRVSMLAFALVAVISIMVDVIWRMTWFRDNDNNDNNNPLIMVLGIAAIVLAPIIASLIQLAISRKREYLADATSALTTRYPEGLASALQKIKDRGSVLRKQNASTAHLFFASPLKGHSLTTLFDTHPPLDDRIARLRQMGNKA